MTADRLINRGYAYFNLNRQHLELTGRHPGLILAYVKTRSLVESKHYPRASQLNNQKPTKLRSRN